MKLYEKICEYCGETFFVEDKRTRFCCRECGYENRRTIKGKNVSKMRLHKIYLGMKDRCYKLQNKAYKHYGARGITICDEWLLFKNFYDWAINNGYSKELTIDRINNDGNYEPNNCRWATRKVQCNNKRSNILITYKGKTQTIALWSKELNLNYGLIWYRYKNNLPIEEIFKKENRKKYPTQTRFIEYQGEVHCMSEWEKIKGFPKSTLYHRFKRGWSIEKALSTPIKQCLQ